MSKTIPLTRGQYAIVDDEDYERLSKMKWTYLHKHGKSEGEGYGVHYYRVGSKVKAVQMHRLITDAPAGMDVDHINGDGLDNRKSNLRVCTRSQNLRNQRVKSNKKGSRFKGVHRIPNPKNPFVASIYVSGRLRYLGVFHSEVAAALAYDDAAKIHYGEFARLNFPEAQAARAA